MALLSCSQSMKKFPKCLPFANPVPFLNGNGQFANSCISKPLPSHNATIYGSCSEWERKHGALFASDEYILVHFTKARTEYITVCPLTLPSPTTSPSLSACDLGVILHKKLSCQPPLQYITSKLATQPKVIT